jgi:hypothetical protein
LSRFARCRGGFLDGDKHASQSAEYEPIGLLIHLFVLLIIGAKSLTKLAWPFCQGLLTRSRAQHYAKNQYFLIEMIEESPSRTGEKKPARSGQKNR